MILSYMASVAAGVRALKFHQKKRRGAYRRGRLSASSAPLPRALPRKNARSPLDVDHWEGRRVECKVRGGPRGRGGDTECLEMRYSRRQFWQPMGDTGRAPQRSPGWVPFRGAHDKRQVHSEWVVQQRGDIKLWKILESAHHLSPIRVLGHPRLSRSHVLEKFLLSPRDGPLEGYSGGLRGQRRVRRVKRP
jgi:hypothetical protein